MLISPDTWRDALNQSWDWFHRIVLVPDTLIQCVALLIACVAVRLAAGPLNRSLDREVG